MVTQPTATSEIVKTFISNSHLLYDELHGKDQITKIFNSISNQQLKEMIIIYQNSHVIHRLNNMEIYVKNSENLKNQAISLYVNALQHFLTK